MLRVRRCRKSKHNPTAELLPDDLIGEILSWLSPKFAGRCKIVCKLWRAIIQSPHFIEQHMQRQDDIMIYYHLPPLLPQDQQSFEGVFFLRGLLLEQNRISNGTYRIRNYATNQVFELPQLSQLRSKGSMCHFPTNDEYKVLNLHRKEDESDIGLEVLTKGTDLTWRCVEVPLLLSCSKEDSVYSRTIGSVCYIMKFSKSGSKMMAFQIEDESFVEISLPRRLEFCATGSRLFPMICEDSYVSIGLFVGEEFINIWVLQDYKTSKWDARKIALPSAFIKECPALLKFIPYSIIDGETLALVVPFFIRKLPWVLHYNFKTRGVSLTRMGDRIRPSLVTL